MDRSYSGADGVTEGGTITLTPDFSSVHHIRPQTQLSALTINLPAVAANGVALTVTFQQGVKKVTWGGGSSSGAAGGMPFRGFQTFTSNGSAWVASAVPVDGTAA